MTKFNIKDINEYKTLLHNKAVAGIVKNRDPLTGKISRQVIDNYFNWLKEKYPTVVSSLDSLLKQKKVQDDLDEAIDLQQETRIRTLIFYILDEELKKEIREQSRQRLNKLFTQTMPLDFQKVDKKEVDSLKIDNSRVLYDTSDVVFLVNGLIEEVFFGLIPRELEKELNREPKVGLNELPAEWNTKRNELFASICAKSIGKVRDLSNLELVEEAINEKCQELIAIIQKVRSNKQEASKEPVCNKPQHQGLEEKLTDKEEKLKDKDKQLAELGKLEQTKFEATRRINSSWHNATMISRGEKEEVLGENWDEEILKKATPEKIIEEQNRLIKLIEDRVEVEKQNQVELEKEIQAKIKVAKDLNTGLMSGDPKELLKELEDYRDKWGISGQATPAQWNAFRKNRVDLNREIDNFSITISRNEAVQAIRNILGNFESDELLAKKEQINFADTLQQLQTSREINRFVENFLTEVIVAKEVRSELMEIVKESENILKENKPDKEKCLELHIKLKMYRDSSLNSSSSLTQARAVSYNRQPATLRRLMNRLLDKARSQQETQIVDNPPPSNG